MERTMKETPHDPQNGKTRQTEQRRVLKGGREKEQVSHKNRPMKTTTDFRVEIGLSSWTPVKCTSETTNHSRR